MQRSTAKKFSVMVSSLLALLVLGTVWAVFLPGPVAAGFTPTATSKPSTGGGGKHDGGNSCRAGAIYGSVADLCQGQPARGVDVLINGNTVRTDGAGRFSLTGLSPDKYTISVSVPGEWQPGSTIITLDTCGQVVNTVLNYNTCVQPTVTPTPSPTGIFYLPETGESKPGGAIALMLLLLLAGLLLGAAVVLYRRGMES